MQPPKPVASEKAELELAAEIQRSMLPETVPSFDGYTFWTFWKPQQMLGGDFYDFVAQGKNQLLVVVGDMAGMGVAGALGAASLLSAVPLAYVQSAGSLSTFMTTLSNVLYRWTARAERFATVLALELDVDTHRLRAVNAGHLAAVIRRCDGWLENLCPEAHVGLPAGLLKDFPYTSVDFQLEPGDVVIIASDGIMNATNEKGENFGAWRLEEVIARIPAAPQQLGELVVSQLMAFVGARPLDDDVVIVCFGRNVLSQS